MSDFRIDKITNRVGDAGTQIAGITTFSGTSGMQIPSGPTEYRGGRGRGIVAGGYNPYTDTINKFEIATTGNAIDFGNLIQALRGPSNGVSSSTRGLFGGGLGPSSNTSLSAVSYTHLTLPPIYSV